MDLKTIVFLLADAAMVLAGIVYGVKFLKKKNYLNGIEWLVMATSGTNFFIWSLTHSDSLLSIAYFFDAFSRAFGFPVVVVAGLMAVTHRYRPSWIGDLLYFLLGSLGAIVLVMADGHPEVAALKPAFYLVMNTVFTIYLLYFASRLHKVGETGHALGVFAVAASSQVIATIYDYFHIPGDDDMHTLFYIAALSTWAFMLVEMYYAYCALERSEEK